MCEHPLVIMSPQSVIYASCSGAEVYFQGVSYTYPTYNTVVSDFLSHYHSMDAPDVYEIVKSSCILYNGVSYPLLTCLPCSKCRFCREDYRQQIEYRAAIEAVNSGCVIYYTLTYDDLHLPECGLYKPHVIDAFKRLRNYCERYLDFDCHFTNLYVGEYGGDRHRPHYHGLLFIQESLTDKQILAFRELFCPTECLSLIHI